MKKYTIGVTGFFGNGVTVAGGQEAKTCSLTRAFREAYGNGQVITADTKDWKKHPISLLCQLIDMANKCNHIVMLPAQNAVRIFVPLFVLLRSFFGCKVHYAVVGGWLPEMTAKRRILSRYAKKLDRIYVETSTMKAALEAQGFCNITVLPNFKFITPVTEEEMPTVFTKPYRLCMFARVMKEKGVEDAVMAVTKINETHGETLLKLDIYGKIHPGYEQRFQELMASSPDYIRYAGMVEPEESVAVLKDYAGLLFPTHYATEGIPGTIVDAYSAGVPVITALWKNSADIFQEGVTGWGYPMEDQSAFTGLLERLVKEPEQFFAMKKSALYTAKKYQPNEVMKQLMADIAKL